MNYLMHTYNPQPIQFVRGEGVWLFDKDGKQYLDAMSGIAVCALGHAHPEVTATIQEQAAKLLHTSNVFEIDHQIQLAEQLCKEAKMNSVFFANSGAEANEAAIKLARLFGHKKGIEEPQTIVMENAFHGRTMATISASGGRKYQAGFEPLVPGFVRAPFNDIRAIEQIAENNPKVCAIFLEPIQGEGGVFVPDDGYLAAIRALCDKHDWLMILDEVQTGMGRTGKLLAYLHENIQPDIVTMAKSLGNGIPIGACLARGQAAELFQPGSHGSTFGGNPFSCAVARTVLAVMLRENIPAQAAEKGEWLKAAFAKRLSGISGVVSIRGKGLMIGIELDRPCRELLAAAREKGLLITVARDYTLRLLPPLIIEQADMQQIVDTLCPLIENFVKESAA